MVLLTLNTRRIVMSVPEISGVISSLDQQLARYDPFTASVPGPPCPYRPHYPSLTSTMFPVSPVTVPLISTSLSMGWCSNRLRDEVPGNIRWQETCRPSRLSLRRPHISPGSPIVSFRRRIEFGTYGVVLF